MTSRALGVVTKCLRGHFGLRQPSPHQRVRIEVMSVQNLQSALTISHNKGLSKIDHNTIVFYGLLLARSYPEPTPLLNLPPPIPPDDTCEQVIHVPAESQSHLSASRKTHFQI